MSNGVGWLTEAVTQLTSWRNANKLVARSTADAENSDNSDSGQGDEENDKRNMVTITIVFTIKSTWQLPFRLIRRIYYLQ